MIQVSLDVIVEGIAHINVGKEMCPCKCVTVALIFNISVLGNVLIVNVALADLLITGLVIPASAVVILSGSEASLIVCQFQWFLAVLSFMVTVLTLASTATENYMRLFCSRSPLTTPALTIMVLGYWAVSGIASGMQFAMDIGFDYCTRK